MSPSIMRSRGKEMGAGKFHTKAMWVFPRSVFTNFPSSVVATKLRGNFNHDMLLAAKVMWDGVSEMMLSLIIPGLR
jgi:hypothetical protein